jgi:hypothetical protein
MPKYNLNDSRIRFSATAQHLVVDWGDGSAAKTYDNVTAYGPNHLNLTHHYNGRAAYTVRIETKRLTTFKCSSNQITLLNINRCAALRELHCWRNQIASLNVSRCTLLRRLYCMDNQITTLDVSGCMALQGVDCSHNQLTAAALDAVLMALPDRAGEDYAAISVSDNPGADGCDRTIAEDKGWRVKG